MNSILLSDLPMPPSSNNQYALIRRGLKVFHVPSKQLKEFKESMQQYPLKRPGVYHSARQKIQEWNDSKIPLEIRCVFFFKKERLLSSKQTFKRLDVSNRIKAGHDCLCRILGIDDASFFRLYAEKTFCGEGQDEMFCAEISPILMSPFSET